MYCVCIYTLMCLCIYAYIHIIKIRLRGFTKKKRLSSMYQRDH